jgi:hypothetical protein
MIDGLPSYITSGIIFVACGLVVINHANELYSRDVLDGLDSKVRIIVHRGKIAQRARKVLGIAVDAMIAGYLILFLGTYMKLPADNLLDISLVIFPAVVVYALLCIRRYVHLKAHMPLKLARS